MAGDDPPYTDGRITGCASFLSGVVLGSAVSAIICTHLLPDTSSILRIAVGVVSVATFTVVGALVGTAIERYLGRRNKQQRP